MDEPTIQRHRHRSHVAVIAFLNSGKVREVFWPTKLPSRNGVRWRSLVVKLEDGSMHELQYQPSAPRNRTLEKVFWRLEQGYYYGPYGVLRQIEPATIHWSESRRVV